MEKRPELDGLDLIAFNDYQLLGTCRQSSGFGIGPISVLDMHKFFDRSGSPEECRELFIACWLAMDSEVIGFYSRKSKAEMEKSKPKGGPGKGGGRRQLSKSEYPEA